MANMTSKEYVRFLNEVRLRIQSSRMQAVRKVNKELIALYWDIGKMIVKKQAQYKWGDSVVERLSHDLRHEFGSVFGFSHQNLWYMRQFYLEYKNDRILQQAVGELPWGHNILILQKVKDKNAREYYLRSCAKLGWSRNVLLNQIKADAYKLSKKKKSHNFPETLPKHLAEQAEESIKSVYNLDFLGITRPVLERELEKRLIEKIKQFLLELGLGFSFIGSQYCLKLKDNEYFVDLLFYNRKLKSLIAIELKVGKFEPEYAGKMDFYLQLLDEQVKMKDENPSIGIILCADKQNVIVEYALRSIKKPVGVAEYYLTKKLPKEFKEKLPEAKMLKESIRQEIKAEKRKK